MNGTGKSAWLGRGGALVALHLLVSTCVFPADPALQSQAQVVIKSPDVSISGTFDLPVNPALLDGLLRSPMLLAHIWEAYDFTPRYKARLQGGGIHVDDPTGIAGDIFPIEQSISRHVFYGTGALNHKLVPAFKGRIALIFSLTPKGSGVSARIDAHIRAESRLLGFLASTLFPLVKTRAMNRMNANMADITTILNDISRAPRQTAARLKKEDADALLRLLPPPPQVKPAPSAPAKPAAKPSSKPAAKPAAKPKP
jgi:hypothetical protein